MALPLIGTIKGILRDQVIEQEEYAQFEQAIFAGDGLIDAFEYEAIQFLVDPQIDPQDQFTFLDPDDRYRAQLIYDVGALTLERYLKALRLRGMSPSSPEEILSKVTREGMADKLPTIEAMTVHDDGTFDIVVQKDGEVFHWNYPYVGEPPLEEVFAEFDYAPCELREIHLALQRDIASSGLTKTKSEEARTISRLIAYLRHLKEERDAELRVPRSLSEEEESELRDRDTELDKRLLQKCDTHKSILREDPRLPQIFYGERPSDEFIDALNVALLSIPQPHVHLVEQRGLEIHLLNCDPLIRDVYNKNPGINTPLGPHPGGFAVWHENRIIIHTQTDPLALAYSVVHELGHFIFHILDGKAGREEASLFGSAAFMPGRVQEVADYHFARLKRMAGPRVMDFFPTRYSSTESHEWWPEIFAVYYFGQIRDQLRGGLMSLGWELSLGPGHLLPTLKDRDPVSYLMMKKYDQLIKRGHPKPEEAFSWTYYFEARRVVEKNHGRIERRAEIEWSRLVPDFAPERDLNAYGRRRDSMRDEGEQYRALKTLNLRHPQFEPIRVEYLAKAIQVKRSKSHRSQVAATLASLLADVEALLKNNPDLPLLRYEIQEMLSVDPVTAGASGEDWVFNPEVLAILERIAEGLMRKNPKDDRAVYDYALALKLQGKFREAFSALAKALRMTKDKNLSLMCRLQMGICSMRLSRYFEADQYLFEVNRESAKLEESLLDEELLEMAFAELARRYEENHQYGVLTAYLIRLAQANPLAFAFASRLLKASTFDERLRKSPEWGKLRLQVPQVIEALLGDEELSADVGKVVNDLRRIYALGSQSH